MKKHLRSRCVPIETAEGTMPRHATFFCAPVHIILPALWLLVAGIGVARGKGAMPPRIFRKYSHFVL